MKYLKDVFILVLILSVLSGCVQKQTSDDATDGLVSNLDPEQNYEIINAALLIQKGADKMRIGLDANHHGIIWDIEDLLWIAPRGGAGIEGGGTEKNISELPIIKESETALIDDTTDWYSFEVDTENLWIRLICAPYKPAQGENSIAHKDIMVYLDNDDNNNAYLGIQSPDDETEWTIIPLPGYGLWLAREIDMIMRRTTGL